MIFRLVPLIPDGLKLYSPARPLMLIKFAGQVELSTIESNGNCEIPRENPKKIRLIYYNSPSEMIESEGNSYWRK